MAQQRIPRAFEIKVLQVVVAVLALVPIVAGLAGAVFGIPGALLVGYTEARLTIAGSNMGVFSSMDDSGRK